MIGRTNTIMKGVDLLSDVLGYLGQTTGWVIVDNVNVSVSSWTAEWWVLNSNDTIDYQGLGVKFPQYLYPNPNVVFSSSGVQIYDDDNRNPNYKCSICKFDNSIYKRMKLYVYNPTTNGNGILNQTYIVSEAIAENDRTNGIKTMHDKLWYEASAHSNTPYIYNVDLTQFPKGMYELLSVRKDGWNGYIRKSISPRFFYE